MRFFITYIKQHIWRLLLLFMCCIIFCVIFMLYHLPIKAVLYPTGLCLILISGFSAFDYVYQYKKHKELSRLMSLPDDLPESLLCYTTINDRDYHAIINLLIEREQNLQTKTNGKMSDMIDYYTTWVHQIKTPIASMKLTLQNEDSVLSRKLSDDLFRIEQYVEMVLTYLRLDSDSTDYVFKEYELDSIIKASLRKFAGQFIGKGIKLNYTPINKKIVTDDKWLTFVIEQIISNALKYTVSGSVTIEMENPETLCIKDTGIGIASEDLPRIFEKGYTGYNGRNDKKASGLGLYLCRRICKNLGHGISAQSRPDFGTTIRICFYQKKIRLD